MALEFGTGIWAWLVATDATITEAQLSAARITLTVDNPIVAVSFLFHGGSALDPADRVGLSGFATSTIDEGAGPLDSFAFQSELQDKAITLRFEAGADDYLVKPFALKEVGARVTVL